MLIRSDLWGAERDNHPTDSHLGVGPVEALMRGTGRRRKLLGCWSLLLGLR